MKFVEQYKAFKIKNDSNSILNPNGNWYSINKPFQFFNYETRHEDNWRDSSLFSKEEVFKCLQSEQFKIHEVDFNRYDKVFINYSSEILGSAFAFMHTLAKKTIAESLLWTWFIGRVTDGYWMTLFSPLIWLNWIIVTACYIPWLCIIGIMYAIASFWTILIEAPASLMNKEKMTLFK
jgi:sensor histidine kinase YesM